MILNELYEKQPEGYHDPEEDQSKARIGDLRKTKLTLKQLNKLRIMNDVRSYERSQKAKKVQQQYGQSEEVPQL
jgi:hypothetical protein